MKFKSVFVLLALLLSESCLAYQLLDARWQAGQAQLWLNFEGNSPSGVSWKSAMREAADSWQQPVSGLAINTPSTSSHHPCDGFDQGSAELERTNAAAFSDTLCSGEFGQNTLAVALLISHNGLLLESDIAFNRRYSWDVFSGDRAGVIDFRRVAVHEVGHFIGLDHESNSPAIMRPVIGSLEGPTADDIAGARAIYNRSPSTSSDIALNLEEPAAKQVRSGISNLRGWAVAKSGVDRIELYIDQELVTELPYGGLRADVANTFPDYPNSLESGFSMAFNWGLLGGGGHDITIVVHDKAGNKQVARSEYTVTAFADAFVGEQETVSVDGPVDVIDQNTLLLQRVNIAGRQYSIRMQWRPASQQWEISNISPI